MLPKEFELEGLMIFLTICFIVAIYIVYKDKKKQKEKKEEASFRNKEYKIWWEKKCFEPGGLLDKEFVLGDESKEEISKEEKKITTPKRKSKYNKDNVLYIAYDFNILGNKSFAEVNRIIEKRKIDKLTKNKFPAVKTTSVLFFNYSYTVSDFEDVILVRKNGRSISIKNLYDNPEHYIPKKYQKGFSLDNYIHQEDFGNDVSGLIYAIYAGIVRFKKEKEI